MATALKVVSPAIPKSSHLPALHGVHIEARGGEVVVTATDLDMFAQHGFEANLSSPGIAVIPGGLFGRVVNALAPGAVTVAVEDAAIVTCGDVQASLNTIDISMWPKVDAIDADPVKLDEAAMAAISQVLYAASRDESRLNLCQVSFADGVVAATDSYRLAFAPIDADIEGLIPANLLRLVLSDGEATVALSNREIGWSSGSTTIRTRTHDVDYPAWRRLVRDDSPVKMTVEAASLAAAVRRAALIAPATPVVLSPNDGGVLVECRGSGGERIAESVQASIDGDMAQIGVNPAFLAEALSLADGDVVIGMVDALKPFVWESGSATHLLMSLNPSAWAKAYA